jgi:hypothetical protein
MSKAEAAGNDPIDVNASAAIMIEASSAASASTTNDTNSCFHFVMFNLTTSVIHFGSIIKHHEMETAVGVISGTGTGRNLLCSNV